MEDPVVHNITSSAALKECKSVYEYLSGGQKVIVNFNLSAEKRELNLNIHSEFDIKFACRSGYKDYPVARAMRLFSTEHILTLSEYCNNQSLDLNYETYI